MGQKTLTEQEIFQMPAASYMNAEQLNYFREQLNELRVGIARSVQETSSHLRSVEVPTDPSDRATQEEEQAIELRARDRERKLLKKIVQALARIEDKTYGYCEETGEPIGLKRLLARPTATLTLEAQERREIKERTFAH